MPIPIVDWSKVEWLQVRPGVERKAYSSDKATVSLNRLQPGHEPRPHSHPHEQIVYMISGRMKFHVEGEVYELGPGGLMTIPSNALHHGEVVGEEEALNLDVFTPRRTEYA
jgi:quercetin dioxygenase-like cupin family protein